MMVTIATFSLPIEAHIARAKLESEGIPAAIADEHTINMQWLYSNAIGGVKIQVPESFEEKAKGVLSRDYSESLIAEMGEDKYHCPQCGSEDVKKQSYACPLASCMPVPWLLSIG